MRVREQPSSLLISPPSSLIGCHQTMRHQLIIGTLAPALANRNCFALQQYAILHRGSQSRGIKRQRHDEPRHFAFIDDATDDENVDAVNTATTMRQDQDNRSDRPSDVSRGRFGGRIGSTNSRPRRPVRGATRRTPSWRDCCARVDVTTIPTSRRGTTRTRSRRATPNSRGCTTRRSLLSPGTASASDATSIGGEATTSTTTMTKIATRPTTASGIRGCSTSTAPTPPPLHC